MSRTDVGDAAPDLELSTHSGEQIKLADYRGKQAVVVFFYPKDGTPACTKEACAFRDAYEDFVEAGAVVENPGSDLAHQGCQALLAPGERCLTTADRYRGQTVETDGREVYLCSPATAAASALNAAVTDPSRYGR